MLRNTFVWVLIVPFVATRDRPALRDPGRRHPHESLAKALIFLPMAISIVGASIIWKFVYEYRPTVGQPDRPGQPDPRLARAATPISSCSTNPGTPCFLIVVMIWIQAGFAMTILSAAIKAIPDDIVEAARLDGVKALRHVPLRHPADASGRR